MYEKHRDLIKTAATAGLSLMALIDSMERLWLYYNNWQEEFEDEDELGEDQPE